jgi:phage-related minor tail protein
MADITLDTLLVKIGADTKPLSDALGGLSKTASGSFSDIEDAAMKASEGMARSLSGFVSGGKLGLEDLKSTALTALGNIADSAIRSGLGSILGSSASTFLGKTSAGVVTGLIGHLFSGRASGGPVAAGTPYVVGEYGRELFVPRVSGTVIPSAGATGQGHRAISITVNVQGGGARAEMKQSAGQVASAVARSLARAERNL